MVNENSTRAVSSKQEKKIAKALGARQVANSGATKFDKGDVVLGSSWLVEAKTCMQPKKSFSIKKEWLEKLREEQFACGKDYNTLCFDFGDNGNRYYIVDEDTIKTLIEFGKSNIMYKSNIKVI